MYSNKQRCVTRPRQQLCVIRVWLIPGAEGTRLTRTMCQHESLHEISDDNGVRVVNSATSENLIYKSTTLPQA
jgi:hypothetical protein